MLPNIVYSGFRNDNDWDRAQTRTLDPYSLLKSDSLNQINTIYGNNTILKGMEMKITPDTESQIFNITIKPGCCIKDKVLIQFNKDTSILINYREENFRELVKDSSIMIVVNYKYEKVVPAPIAKIEVIQEDDYDPEIHLGLCRIFFDSEGNYTDIVRLITPKDNILYEEILQEINSTASSAVYNVLGELGADGIGELLGTYIRVKGTAISGDYPDKNYFLCDSIPKVEAVLSDELGTVWRNSLHIITTFEANNKYYHNDYILKLDPNTYNEETPSWNVYTQVLNTDTKVNSYLPYSDIIVYEDRERYYVYAWFKGTIYGSIEVYETEFNSDQVIVKNISKEEPNESVMTEVLKVSDRLTPHAIIKASFNNNKTTRTNTTTLDLDETTTRDDATMRNANNIPSSYRVIKTNTYINNCLIWNESNDGSGSGLDADLLDGREGSWYASMDNIIDLEVRVQEKLDALTEEVAAVRKIAEDAIPKAEKHKPSGVAILTNSDGTYLDDYEPDVVKEWTPEELEEHTKTDSAPTGGALVGKVVPQSELYIYRMFGDETHPESVEFTYSNKNPTGTNRINCEGHFHATKVYNPAYKDIAEVFEANQDCSMSNCLRKIMSLDTSSGLLRKCRPTDYTVVGVCSDTYGYLLGASETDITQSGHLLPIGLAGTVWVDIENTLEPDVNYLGCLIGVGDNGKGRIMARTDKRYCVGMVVECNPDENSKRVKILLGNRWTV